MSDFVVESDEGPEGFFGVFEDDGRTGYLYIYKPDVEPGILRDLHIYNRSESLDVHAEDVRVIWSANQRKCGVVIWGKMRGIIDLAPNRQVSVALSSRSSPGVEDSGWLEGFYEQ